MGYGRRNGKSKMAGGWIDSPVAQVCVDCEHKLDPWAHVYVRPDGKVLCMRCGIRSQRAESVAERK